MAYTYDVSTDVGKIRLMAMDNDADTHVFEDDEIEAFFALESSNHRRAAALALESLAGNEAYVLKKITALDLSTDGPATAKALMDRAKALRDQALEAEAREEDGAFDIAELVYTSFNRRERIINEALRNNG